MAEQPRNEDAQKQLEMMQKMLEDASKILGDIHKEVKARRDARQQKENGGDAPKE